MCINHFPSTKKYKTRTLKLYDIITEIWVNGYNNKCEQDDGRNRLEGKYKEGSKDYGDELDESMLIRGLEDE